MIDFPLHQAPPVVEPLANGALQTSKVQSGHPNEALDTHQFGLESPAPVFSLTHGLQQGWEVAAGDDRRGEPRQLLTDFDQLDPQ